MVVAFVKQNILLYSLIIEIIYASVTVFYRMISDKLDNGPHMHYQIIFAALLC
jgi:hypothetical protein